MTQKVTRSQTRKVDAFIFQKFQPTQQTDLKQKKGCFLFPGKMLVCGWSLPYLEVNE